MKQHKTLSKWLFVIIYCSVIAVCIALDQLTKLLIFDKLLEGKQGNGIDVLGKFLRFFALYNSGASFGLGQSDAANIVFFVITVIGIPVFAFLLWRSRKRSVCGQVGYAFIIGGTIGNAIDRCFVATTEGKFFSGKVRDFISFSIFPPVFNIADSFLVIGVFLVLLAVLFLDPDGLLREIQKQKAKKDTAQEGEDGALQSAEQVDGSETVEQVDGETAAQDTESRTQNTENEADISENNQQSTTGGISSVGVKTDDQPLDEVQTPDQPTAKKRGAGEHIQDTNRKAPTKKRGAANTKQKPNEVVKREGDNAED